MHARAPARAGAPASRLASPALGVAPLAWALAALASSGCTTSHAPPGPCTVTDDCPLPLVCDRARSICVECNVDGHCAAGYACFDHACTPATACDSSRDCPGLVCDLGRGICVECLTDVDCPGEEVCVEARCAAPPPSCVSDRDCSGLGLVCDFAAGFCVECVRDADCGTGGVCVAAACTFPTPDAGLPDVGPAPATDDLDLLFMVDNSNSMSDEQALLSRELPRLVQTLVSGDRNGDGIADFTPVGTLHVGIVTSDMGAGPGAFVVPTCSAGYGDDGILRTAGDPSNAGCSPPYPPIFGFTSGPDDPASFAAEVGCVAIAGTGGCGFEQQLESVLKALSPAAASSIVAPWYAPPSFAGGGGGRGDGPNAGFLREGTVLAVVVASDEEDCSVPDYSLFYPVAPYDTSALNLRCHDFPEALYPTSRYVEGLLQLRTYARRLVFAGFVGVPEELAGSDPAAYERALADARVVERLDASVDPAIRLLPSCSTADGGSAYPPRRFLETAAELARRGSPTTMQSICAADFRAGTNALIDALALALGGG